MLARSRFPSTGPDRAPSGHRLALRRAQILPHGMARERQWSPRGRPRAQMRGVRSIVDGPSRRSGVRTVLGPGSRHHPAPVRSVRRCAAGLARTQPTGGAVSALPPFAACRRSRSCGGRVRGSASRDRSRAQVRTAPVAGRSPGRSDASARRGRAARRGRDRAGAAPSSAAARARLQSVRGSGPRSRIAGHRLPGPRPGHGSAGRAANRPAASKRASGVRGSIGAPMAHSRPAADLAGRLVPGSGGRCDDDGSHAGGVRAGTEGRGRTGGSGAHGCASRAETTWMICAATSSLLRSPSIRAHPVESA